MPSKAMKPCGSPGCPRLTTSKYCEDHAKNERQYDKERGSASKRGYNRAWQKARRTYLSMNPFCVECMKEGQVTPSTVVDHIEAHKGNRALFWDEKNWQALCASCHSRKTRREDMGAW